MSALKIHLDSIAGPGEPTLNHERFPVVETDGIGERVSLRKQ